MMLLLVLFAIATGPTACTTIDGSGCPIILPGDDTGTAGDTMEEDRGVPPEDQWPPTDTPSATDTLAVDDVVDVLDVIDGEDLAAPPEDTSLDTAPEDLWIPPEDLQDADIPPEIVPTPVGIPAFNEVRCHGDDFVEIVNLSAEDPVPLAGWTLTDDPFDAAKLWPLPEDLVLPPGGRVVLHRQTPDDVGFTFGLGCGTDTVFLLDPEDGIADSVALPLLPLGDTWGRLPDGTGDWTQNAPTPGAENLPAPDLEALLFDPFKVIYVDISLPEVSIESLGVEPYVYVPGEISFTIDGETHPWMEAGIRIKGRWGSYRPLTGKSAFKVKMNFSVQGQTFLGLKKFTLNNMVQDKAMLHEALAYRIFRTFGIPCPRTGYAWVTVNGEDYGLYANIESPDAIFLSRFYPGTTHLYEGDYTTDVLPGQAGDFEIDEGNPNNISDLMFLIAAAQVEDAVWLETIEPWVDLEEMTRMWLVEQYIGHWDGYAPTINNYYLHSDGDSLFTMLPWGLDQTFAQVRNLYEGKGHLFVRCLGLKTCRDQYEAALIALMPVLGDLDPVPWIEALAESLQPWVEADPRKEYSAQIVVDNVASTIAFLLDREEAMTDLVDCISDPAQDLDGDGYQCQWDCNEEDPETFLGAPEICGDGVDQSCSGMADDEYDCPDCVEIFRGLHRYLFCPVPRPFIEAEPHCAEVGAGQVIINDAAENLWVLSQLGAFGISSPWLGLNDLAEEGVWLWTDGSAPGFLNWSTNEPNNSGDEDCTQMLSTGLWNDIKCGMEYAVICEDACLPGEDQDCDGVPDQLPDDTANLPLAVEPPIPGAAFFVFPASLA